MFDYCYNKYGLFILSIIILKKSHKGTICLHINKTYSNQNKTKFICTHYIGIRISNSFKYFDTDTRQTRKKVLKS